jgi:hypothetical protein
MRRHSEWCPSERRREPYRDCSAEAAIWNSPHGTDRYREQEWDDAKRLIERCRKLAGGFGVDGLYEMYKERIEVYRVEPPPPDWTGVYEAVSK